MKIIIYYAPIRKTWTNEKCENIGDLIGECLNCGSIGSFEYEYTSNEWRWDIVVPENWTFGQWKQAELLPVKVPLPACRCKQCNQMIKIIPSFCLRGTTLTLQALVFIGFVYEYSELSWRDLSKKFCDEKDRIAHSTLYKAVHGVGKLVSTEQEIEDLRQKYLPINNPVEPNQTLVWPPDKSLFTHTIDRENGIRTLLKKLLPAKSLKDKFSEFLYRYVNSLNRIFAKWNKPIPQLYAGVEWH